MTMIADLHRGLPDAVTEAEFYEGVPAKRFLAWTLDVTAIAVLTVVALPFTLFTGLFYLPFLFMLIGFLDRWVSLTRMSATPGMRFAAIELREDDGGPLDSGTAVLHVAGYMASMAVFPVQLLSIALMFLTARRQGLTDLVLGTAAIRRIAR
jgi:uncharacterized RDD family membrane protein YckC